MAKTAGGTLEICIGEDSDGPNHARAAGELNFRGICRAPAGSES